MATFKIPLTPEPQTFFISLAGVKYRLTLRFRAATDAGWVLDIADAQGAPLVEGIALVTGTDLLAPYAYLGIGGKLVVRSDADPDAVPTFANLGVGSQLYFAPA